MSFDDFFRRERALNFFDMDMFGWIVAHDTPHRKCVKAAIAGRRSLRPMGGPRVVVGVAWGLGRCGGTENRAGG